VNSQVFIFDTTLRDGEQSPGCSMTVDEKIRMAAKLEELAVDIVEAGFPIASEGDFAAVETIGRFFPRLRVAALARACKLDIERALRALARARRPRLHTFIATSDIHLRFKLKKSRQQVLDEAVAAVEMARAHVDDVEFSAEDATRTDPEYLAEVCARWWPPARHGQHPGYRGLFHARRVRPADRRTGSGARPQSHRERPLSQRPGPGDSELSGRGTGGGSPDRVHHQWHRRACGQLLTGRGGDGDQDPPGPASLSDEHRHRTDLSRQPGALAAHLLRPAAQQGHRRSNAFAHEAGIHQDGFLKERTTYEIMDPRTVGVPASRLVLGKHSGRHALGIAASIWDIR